MNMNMMDWGLGLTGGLMIGAASALFLLMNGKIAGISGILGGLLGSEQASAKAERLAFLAGLVVAPVIWVMTAGAPEITPQTAPAILIAAGLLVGVGTRMGSGCTSGHGVCGLSRFSVRSLVGVATFMAVGVIVLAVGRHVIGGL